MITCFSAVMARLAIVVSATDCISQSLEASFMTMRLAYRITNGEASIDLDDPLTDSYPGALCVVRVRARSIFPNCRRYVHEYRKVSPSPFVPRGDVDPPVPDWKQDPWFEGTLPSGDPALDPDRPSAPAIPRF